MSHFAINLGQTAEDSDMFTNIWLSSIGLNVVLNQHFSRKGKNAIYKTESLNGCIPKSIQSGNL